jgi:hypothetical protein
MQPGEPRQLLVTLGPFYLNRRNGGPGPTSIGITTAVEFVGIAPDLDRAATMLRARLALLVTSNGLNGYELPDIAQRVFDTFTDPEWVDLNGRCVADHIRLRQLNLVTSDPAEDALSPVTVVTVSR